MITEVNKKLRELNPLTKNAETEMNPLDSNETPLAKRKIKKDKGTNAKTRDISTDPKTQEKSTNPKMNDKETDAWKRDG